MSGISGWSGGYGLWAVGSERPNLPTMITAQRTSSDTYSETIVVLRGWVAVHDLGGHVFVAPDGTSLLSKGRTALQFTAEPLMSHVLVRSLNEGRHNCNPEATRWPV